MSDLTPVFKELRAIMEPYAEALDCKTDSTTSFYLNTRHIQKNKKPLFFGAVQLRKRYVSYHLMPVYTDPDLLDSISPELKKRMQGKSCFNFNNVDEELFEELATLTDVSFQCYQSKGYI